MSDPVYKRILIKISGEALAGDKKTGFDFDFMSKVCETVNKCTQMGVEVGIVVGGGNFWRGVKDGAGHVERVSADRMGMLATAMNCLAFADVLRQSGGEAKVLTAVDIQGVGERYSTDKAIEYLKSGKVVMFGCGTGCPFSRLTPPPCFARPRSERTRYCLQRTSTACTRQTRRPIRALLSMTA